MNNSNRGPGSGQASSGDQSALSLLVNAADSRDNPRGQRDGNAGLQGRTLADTLRLRGLTGEGGPTLEEQLFLQQQSQGYGMQGNLGLLSQLRDQNMLLSQLGQQQQLASLLGLGGGGAGSNQAQDMRQALAAAQLRQSQAAQQLTNADILALTRSGALSGLSNFLGGSFSGGGQSSNFGGGTQGGSPYMSGSVGGGNQGQGFVSSGGQGIASELEGLQRLEELERRQRLLGAGGNEARGSSPAVAARMETESAAASMPSEQPKEQQAEPRAEPAQSDSFKGGKSPSSEPVPAPENTKEELEKTPGSVIVPCRARGMPMDHNFKTAFFVIPENVKHGEELICSYFACRNAGIKFRYCSHCKVPVAKRNFRKRHKHGGDPIPKGVDDDSIGEENVAVKKGIPSQITANREEAAEADGISSQSADSTNQQENIKNVSEADVQQGLVRNSMRTFETTKTTNVVTANAVAELAAQVDDRKISEDRRQRWVSLLAKRPSTKDGDSMSGWLMEVLAVSDLETPLKPMGEVAEEEMKNKSKKDKPKDSRKKRAERSSNESPRSDIGYGSSNDDSGTNDVKKEPAREKANVASFNSGIVKKKRPATELSKNGPDQGKAKSNSYVSGSFAEWKERKKQKKQSKASAHQQDQT